MNIVKPDESVILIKSTVYFSFRSILVFLFSIQSHPQNFSSLNFVSEGMMLLLMWSKIFNFDLMFSFPLVISLTKRYMKLM